MTANGDAAKPIWITEIGWPTHADPGQTGAMMKGIIRSGLKAIERLMGMILVAIAIQMFLTGADMPAVLIEAGYLTNRKQEKNLNDNKYLFKLATAISQGCASLRTAGRSRFVSISIQ